MNLQIATCTKVLNPKNGALQLKKDIMKRKVKYCLVSL
jgi:hypothetical protein